MVLELQYKDTLALDIGPFEVKHLDRVRHPTLDPNYVHDAEAMAAFEWGSRTYRKHPIVLGTQIDYAIVNALRRVLSPVMSLDRLVVNFKGPMTPGELYSLEVERLKISEDPIEYEAVRIDEKTGLPEKIRYRGVLKRKEDDKVMLTVDDITFRTPYAHKRLVDAFGTILDPSVEDYVIRPEDVATFSKGVLLPEPLVDPAGFAVAFSSGIISRIAQRGVDPILARLATLTAEEKFPVYDKHIIETSDFMDLLGHQGAIERISTNVHSELVESGAKKDRLRFKTTVVGYTEMIGQREALFRFYSEIFTLPFKMVFQPRAGAEILKDLPPEGE